MAGAGIPGEDIFSPEAVSIDELRGPALQEERIISLISPIGMLEFCYPE